MPYCFFEQLEKTYPCLVKHCKLLALTTQNKEFDRVSNENSPLSQDSWMHFLMQPAEKAASLYENAFKAAMAITNMPVTGVTRVRHETHLRVEALVDQISIGYRAGDEIPVSEMLENEVLLKRDTIVIPDVATSPLARHPARQKYNIRSFIGTPLLGHNQQPYGVLSLVDRRPHPLGTEELLRIGLVGQWLSHALSARHLATELHAKRERVAALSHEIQKLQTQIEQGSIRDAITDLYNSRHFNRLLQVESNRAQRHAYPLSLLLVYPDGMHQIARQRGSDITHGILRSIGVLLRRHLRNIDSAARYSEEVFGILLPQTDMPGASIVAERIRSQIANHRFKIGASSGENKELLLTVSVGISSLSATESEPANGLLARARGAIQQARNSGGNRVVAAQTADQTNIPLPHVPMTSDS